MDAGLIKSAPITSWSKMPWRLVSWLLATPLALILLLHPAAILGEDGSYSHSLVMLVMYGTSIGFTHAVGYRPVKPVFRYLMYPLLGWVLMLWGYVDWFR